MRWMILETLSVVLNCFCKEVLIMIENFLLLSSWFFVSLLGVNIVTAALKKDPSDINLDSLHSTLKLWFGLIGGLFLISYYFM